jgi:hypothetical protein
MLKKTMLLVASACALAAFAAPAGAQAQELYQKGPKGEHNPLAVGAEVKATSTDLKVTLGWLGTLECAKVIIKNKVLENKSNKSRTGSAWWEFEGGCNTPVTEQAINEIILQEAGVITDLKFTATSCHLYGNPPLTYKHDTNTLTVTGKEQLTAAPPCWYYRVATMTASFTLTTPTGTPVYIE